MPAPSSHEPAGAALDDARVTVELINDGVHVPDTMARTAARAAGPERFALITDAISATGMPDGLYQLGALKVNVNQGIVRLEDGSTLAGSTLTMDAALRRAVRDLGLPIEDAVRSASTTPAEALRLADRVGSITVGHDADLVVLDEELEVRAVMRRGAW